MASGKAVLKVCYLAEGENSSIQAAQLGFLPSLDQPIRSGEHLRRDRQADLLAELIW
jgi:hypothetical protein